MIEKLKNLTYSLTRKTITVGDEKQKDHNEGKKKKGKEDQSDSHQEHSQQEFNSPTYQVTFQELKEIVKELNELSHVRNNRLTFICLDGKPPLVRLVSKEGQIIQELLPYQVLEVLQFAKKNGDDQKGMILNISC